MPVRARHKPFFKFDVAIGAALESASVGLDDRDALRVLRDAFDPGRSAPDNEFVRRFYTHWFALDAVGARPVPARNGRPAAAFAHALHWVYGELVAQRAEEPVAFLAQLGRDHRKYGVLPDALRDAARALLRDAAQPPGRAPGPTPSTTRPAVAEPDHRGDERRRRRREGPPGGTAPSSNTSGCRAIWRSSGCGWTADALSPRPVRQRPGAAVPAPLAISEPGDSGRPRRRHRVSRPPGARRLGQHRHRQRNPAGRPVAVVQPARRPAGRPRRRRRADGRRQHRPGAAAGADHGPQPVRREPAGAPVLRRPLPLRALRPAHAVADRRRTTRGCRCRRCRSTTATRRGPPTIPT